MTISLKHGGQSVPAYSAMTDYLRFAAAVVIVLFHTHTLTGASDVVAVGFFAITMVFFALQSLATSDRTALGPYMQRRMRRLLYPFLVWALLHAALKAASVGFDPAALPGEFALWLPPDGSFAQLWFLPWAFAVTAGLAIAFRSGAPTLVDPGHAPAAILSAVLAAGLLLWVQTSAALPLFPRLCVLYSASVVTGLLAFSLRQMPGVLWLATAVMVATGVGLQSFAIRGTEQLTIALPLFVAALSVPLVDGPWPRFLGRLSLDVYLCHILVIAACRNFGGFSVSSLPGGLTALALSILVALAIRTTPLRRWLS